MLIQIGQSWLQELEFWLRYVRLQVSWDLDILLCLHLIVFSPFASHLAFFSSLDNFCCAQVLHSIDTSHPFARNPQLCNPKRAVIPSSYQP
jgi:hypothetical protein